MKKKLYILLLLFSVVAGLGSLSCDNDDDSGCVGIDCLPPATQTGEGTFGCLVNGEPFVDNSGNFNCFYQLVDGEYFFNISPSFDDKVFRQISIGTKCINFMNENIILLSNDSCGNGLVSISINNEFRDIETDDNYNGTLIIENFNLTNNLISATFEFEIFDEVTQTLYTVTDGRFDAQFTQ